jgi:hypothetical protein
MKFSIASLLTLLSIAPFVFATNACTEGSCCSTDDICINDPYAVYELMLENSDTICGVSRPGAVCTPVCSLTNEKTHCRNDYNERYEQNTRLCWWGDLKYGYLQIKPLV